MASNFTGVDFLFTPEEVKMGPGDNAVTDIFNYGEPCWSMVLLVSTNVYRTIYIYVLYTEKSEWLIKNVYCMNILVCEYNYLIKQQSVAFIDNNWRM